MTVAAAAAAAALAAGCGGGDNTTQTQKIPPVNVTALTGKTIQPVPQAPKFTGTAKDVAAEADAFAVAFNTHDAKFLCTKGYTAADLKVLNSTGKCVLGITKFLKAFKGYRLDISKIVVDGDTAQVTARAISAVNGKPNVETIPLTFVKENGQWRASINAKQTAATGKTGAAGDKTKK